MPGSSPQGPLGSSLIPPIDAGTSALTTSPGVGSVGVDGTPATGPTPATATPAATATETDPEIEVLDLTGDARKGAYALKKAHPSVKFTSGKRDKDDQARAMAGNVVENRKWIEETYAETDISKACQKWVDDHPEKKTKDEIKDGLLAVLNDHTDAQLAKLSKHLSGEAFDVQPVETDADAIKKSIRDLDGLDKFLEKEGGLVRWHAQF